MSEQKDPPVSTIQYALKLPGCGKLLFFGINSSSTAVVLNAYTDKGQVFFLPFDARLLRKLLSTYEVPFSVDSSQTSAHLRASIMDQR